MSVIQSAVGHVVGLYRFPVKSMAGESCMSMRLGWQGFEADRRYSFIRTGSMNGLPFVSARQTPELIAYRATLNDSDDPSSDVIVCGPDEACAWPVADPALSARITQVVGCPVHLIHLHRGAFDAMPVAIITTGSMKTIGDSLDIDAGLDPRRFRANIVIEAFAERAFPEEKWIGGALAFGEGTDPARVRANRKPKRCSIVNVNPDTGSVDLAVHSVIVQRRKNELGIWGSPERTGIVRLGDVVYLR